MKIKSGFILREVNGSYIAVAVGERAQEFNGIINLNKTGAFIWECLENDTNEAEIVSKMMKVYDVDESTALSGARKIISVLSDAGIIENEE